MWLKSDECQSWKPFSHERGGGAGRKTAIRRQSLLIQLPLRVKKQQSIESPIWFRDFPSPLFLQIWVLLWMIISVKCEITALHSYHSLSLQPRRGFRNHISESNNNHDTIAANIIEVTRRKWEKQKMFFAPFSSSFLFFCVPLTLSSSSSSLSLKDCCLCPMSCSLLCLSTTLTAR